MTSVKKRENHLVFDRRLVKEAKILEVWAKVDRAVRDHTKDGSELQD